MSEKLGERRIVIKIEYEQNAVNSKMIVYDKENDSDPAEAYEIRMVSENKPISLLRYHKIKTNGEEKYEYDITSMLNIKNMYDFRLIRYTDLNTIVGGLTVLMKEIEDYFLSSECILLSPETFYIDEKSNTVGFCYYPYKVGDFKKSLVEIAEFILERTDHSDKKAVKIAYDLYQQIIHGNYNISGLIGNNCEEPDISKQNDSIRDDEAQLGKEEIRHINRENTVNQKEFSENRVYKKKDTSMRVIVFFTLIISLVVLVIIYTILFGLNVI